MIRAFDTASMSPRWPTDWAWPTTQEAWHDVHAERGRLAIDVRGFGQPDGKTAGHANAIRLPVRDAGTRLDRLAAVLDNAQIVDDPRTVSMGRRTVTVEEVT